MGVRRRRLSLSPFERERERAVTHLSAETLPVS